MADSKFQPRETLKLMLFQIKIWPWNVWQKLVERVKELWKEMVLKQAQNRFNCPKVLKNKWHNCKNFLKFSSICNQIKAFAVKYKAWFGIDQKQPLGDNLKKSVRHRKEGCRKMQSGESSDIQHLFIYWHQ